MSVFKCKMCGASVVIVPGTTVCECDSCGTQQTISACLGDERRANLYDRANHFRRNNEYDKAEGIYEQLLNEDANDAEVFWSLVLCKFGVEYVEDPSTHRRVPTVNRTQYTSIFDDENYKQALRLADSKQRILYEQEALAINEIQKGILLVSQKEEPFDIFICYKETDSSGRRTHDSVLANELYFQLVHEGYRVFFSKITLEDKLGAAYEPYIFAALNSSKVMIVLGTKPEYFNAPWVKNEWSRYLTLVKQSNGAKTLIPAYRDMDPYDMPEEFSHLQALDMARLGFAQDLIHGIKKLIRKETPEYSSYQEVKRERTKGDSKTADWLQRGRIYLEDGLFERANEYYEKVLDVDVENAEAYLGKLMIELKLRDESMLRNNDKPLDTYANYNRAVRFGDAWLVNKIKAYNAEIKERLDLQEKADIFRSAMDEFNAASMVIDNPTSGSSIVEARICVVNAEKLFASISGYKTADKMVHECEEYVQRSLVQEKEAIYREALVYKRELTYGCCEKAKELFQQIRDYKDAEKQIEECDNRVLLLDRVVWITVASVIAVLIILLSMLNTRTAKIDRGAHSFGSILTSSGSFVLSVLFLVASTAGFCRLWIQLRRKKILVWKDGGTLSRLVKIVIGVAVVSLVGAVGAALPVGAIEAIKGFTSLLFVTIVIVVIYYKRK